MAAPKGTNKEIALSEDSEIIINPDDFGFSDSDGHTLLADYVANAPANGQLMVGDHVYSLGDRIIISGMTDQLRFVPASNFNGTTDFIFVAQDSSHVYASSTNTMTFQVAAVSDAPEGTDNTIQVTEDTAHRFSTAEFGFSDVDGDGLSGVIITTLPDEGHLIIATGAWNGYLTEFTHVRVTEGQVVPAHLLDYLWYVPAGEFNGTASFTFQVVDDSGAPDGLDTDQTPNTITLDVQAERDPLVTDGDVVSVADTSDANDQASSVVKLANGHQIVTWQSWPGGSGATSSFMRLLDTAGNPIGAEIRVSENDAGYQGLPRAAALPGGEFAVVFNTADGKAAFRIFDSTGTPLTGDIAVAIDDPGPLPLVRLDIASTGDGFVVYWMDYTGIPSFQRYDAAGTAVGAIIEHDIVKLSADCGIEGTRNGGFVLAWVDGDDQPRLSIFDQDGQLVGSPVVIPHSGALAADVTELANGDFVVVWFTSNGDVFAQHISPNGNLLGDTFELGPSSSFSHRSPKVTALDGGGYVVVWHALVDSFHSEVHYQVFGSDGTPLGPEARANPLTYGSFGWSNVAARDDGGFTITWTGPGPNGKADVYLKSFAPSLVGEDVDTQILEDGALDFAPGTFTGTDADGDAIAAIVIRSIPSTGTLWLGGEPLSAGDEVDLEDIANLVWLPAPNLNGDGIVAFTFAIKDEAGDVALANNRVIVDIVPVSDAPEGADATVVILEDRAYCFCAADFATRTSMSTRWSRSRSPPCPPAVRCSLATTSSWPGTRSVSPTSAICAGSRPQTQPAASASPSR